MWTETVGGRLDVAGLGVVLMHEHLFVLDPELHQNYPNPEWNEDDMVALARDGLRRLKALGIDTLVDVTVLGLGRNIPLIQRVCEGLDFNVVVATGCYIFNELPHYFHAHGPGLRIDMDDPLPAMFIRDIETGIADTGVKAAIIKVASDLPGFTKDVTRVFEAAVRAQRETNATITTHSSVKTKGGLEQVRWLAKAGAKLDRVVIGHCGDSIDLDYLKAILDFGCTIGMDRFGLTSYLATEDRIETVRKLVELGYAEQMTLSQDAGFYSSNTEPSFRKLNRPDWTHFLLAETVLPELRRRGVPQGAIDTMMVGNAARLLGLRT